MIVATATLGSNPVVLFVVAGAVYPGSFIYGGGLVLIPFIELYAVQEFGWMTGREFVDGIAVLGALVATIGAFGPSFVFIMGFFPYFAKVRENDVVQTALIGVNAAVVSAIHGATVTLAAESFVDAFTVALAVVTFELFHRGVHAAYLILGGGAVGMTWFFFVL